MRHPVLFYHSPVHLQEKKNTWNHLSNELWLSFENVNVKPIYTLKVFYCWHSFLGLSVHLPSYYADSYTRQQRWNEKIKKIHEGAVLPKDGRMANLLLAADACYCVLEQRVSIWFRRRNIAATESVAHT